MKSSCGKFCLLYAAFWILSALIALSPGEFNIGRAITEYTFWFRFAWYSYRRFLNPFVEDPYETNFNPLHHTVGDPNTFPHNEPDLHYITYTRENFTLEQAAIDTNNFDKAFVVKGFATDLLGKFDYDYVMENFKPDEYDFEAGRSFTDTDKYKDGRKRNFKHVTYTLQEGLKRMLDEKLYLRFTQTLAPRNPEFNQALRGSIERLGPMFAELVGQVDKANRLCFIGMGTNSMTTQHNAITDNWFLQVAGTKQWVLVPPEYTPYMKPHFTPTIAMGSLLPLYNESMGLQVVTMESDPGDLLYFPGFWWHEVHNKGEHMNFGCGIRPRESVARLLGLFNPIAAKPSGSFGAYLVLWPDALRVIYNSLPKKMSGLFPSLDDFDPAKHNKWWSAEGRKQKPEL